MALPDLLSRYLAHFGEPLPPVLTSDAADWVKEDFMRQALRRVGASGERVVEDVGKGSCRGVACYTRTSAQSAALSDKNCGVNHPSGPKGGRPVVEESRDKRPQKNLLTDERLDTAPEGVRDARRRLRGLIPEASRLHLELVVASRVSEGATTKEKEKALKARRARLVEKLCEVLDERDSLWAVIEDYLSKADE